MSATPLATILGDFLRELAGELLWVIVGLAAVAGLIALAVFALRALGVDVRMTSGSEAGTSRFSFETTVADPLVYRLDAEQMERARLRLAAGEEMDAVCLELNPEYAGWPAGQQEAFRRLVRSALLAG